MVYKSPQEMPFNITPETAKSWNDFVNLTLAGNSIAAIRAYHSYSIAKQKVFETKRNRENQEMSF